MLDYVREHWVGRQTLAWSFWINFALLCVVINVAETLIRPNASGASWVSVIPTIVYLIVGHLVIYPWQVIGLVRACNRHLKQSSDSAIVTGAQLAIAASVIVGVTTVTTTVQSILGATSTAIKDGTNTAEPAYEIEFLAEHSLIRLDGEFANGLTRDLRQLIVKKTGIRGMILNSDGGRIFEARGVAKVIGERRLATYVYGVCQSACTTAFIAGSPRRLGEQGRLGFHRYRLKSVYPLIDVDEEQEKDRAFYRAQGVAPDLLARIFKTPHDTMWYPTKKELLGAGVIDEVVPHQAM